MFRPTASIHSSSVRTRRKPRRPFFEALEARSLLSVSTLSFAGSSPDGFSGNTGVYDSQGNLWVADHNLNDGDQIDRITLDGQGKPTIASTITFPNGEAPRQLVLQHRTAGTGDRIFFIDDNSGNIDSVDPSTGLVTGSFSISSSFGGGNATPSELTAANDGSIWWRTTTSSGAVQADGLRHATLVVGRVNPDTSDVQYFTVNSANPAVFDSQIVQIAPNGADGIYIGLQTVDQVNQNTSAPYVGHNYIATARFGTGAITGSVYTLSASNSDDTTANANNYLTSVASDAGNGLWFTLANRNFGNEHSGQTADRIVHGTLSGSTVSEVTYTLPGVTAANPQTIGGLSFDGVGRVWFANQNTDVVGFFDTADHSFTMDQLPDSDTGVTTGVASLITNHAAGSSTAWVTTNSAGYTLLNVTVNSVVADTPLTITGSTFSALPLKFVLTTVTFTDDVGSNASWFTATITWGDNTTSQGVIVADPTLAGRYFVVGLHHYAKKGSYHITATITTSEVGAVIASNVAAGTVTVK